MSSFDSESKFLILGDKKLDDIIDRYEDSDQYRSYKRYRDFGLSADIKNLLIPVLNEILDPKDIYFSQDDFNVDIHTPTDFADSMRYSVSLSLKQENGWIFDDKDNPKKGRIGKKSIANFELMTFPYMERSGILYFKGINSPYVIINSLTLSDSITFDGSKLKFVDGEHSLLMFGGSNPKIQIFSADTSVIDFVTMMAKYQYGESVGTSCARRFIDSIRNLSVISGISGNEADFKRFGSEAAEMSIEQRLGAINNQRALDFGFDEKVKSGLFATTTTRSILNEITSLRNAIGKTLSRDIVTSDGRTIAESGTVVTESIVSLCNKNFVDTIFVEKSINMIGRVIAETIILGNTIYKGTPVIPEMSSIFPELENYRDADKDYTLPEGSLPIMISTGTSITEDLCRCLEYLNIRTIKYTDKHKASKILSASFEEEYVNNRHFPIDDVVVENDVKLEDSDQWVYVDENGQMSTQSDVLTCHDVAALCSVYFKLLNKEHYSQIADPDSGLRKQVEQCYDHFHKAFIHCVRVFVKSSSSSLLRVAENSSNFNVADKMNAVFKFFGKNFYSYMRKNLKVLDTLEVINPVATLSSLTKINTIVKDDNSIADSMRRLTMGHYGRICPYETPQSKKLGIVNNMAIGCEIEEGIMYTHYYPLRHEGDKIYLVKNPVRMSIVEEEKYRISDIQSIDVNWKTMEVTAKGRVPARIPSNDSLEKMSFACIDLKNVQYVSTSANQHESYTCTTVPFAGSDDAARLSFGTSMVKQAKGLVNAEIPRVCTTGFMNICNKNTFYKIFAEDFGRVMSVDTNSITVKYDSEEDVTTYRFRPMTISSNSAIVRVAEVNKGQRIQQGQTLISSNYTRNGVMAIGANAIIAIMTDGYNYEDGVHGSKRISRKLTSYGVHTDSFKVKRNVINAVPTNFRYGDYLKEDDKMFTLEYKVDRSTGSVRSTMRADHCRGFIADYTAIRDVYNTSITREIKVRTVSFDQLNESDKICNRHGNKGVACKIDENSEMPYFENGEIIDIKYNPSGIVSRMNIGQTLEASLGLACYVLDIQVLCDSFNSPKSEDIKMLLSYTVDLANESNMASVFKKYPMLPKELHEHCRHNIKRIRHWRGTFDKDCRAYLIDPKSGKRTLTRVNVGVNYIYKLVQEGESKMHARGGLMTSPYVQKTESPTKGASNGGGQRMGYMELDAYLAYGASSLVSELVNERGNNCIARNNFTVDAIHSGRTEYMLDPKYQIRRSNEWLFELFKSIGLQMEFTDNEICLDSPEKRGYYKVSALKDAKFGDEEEEEDEETRIANTFMDNFKKLRGSK